MIYVVTGPPGAGKSTWCRRNAGPDDIVIDYDVLAVALTGERDTTHQHGKSAGKVAHSARHAAIDTALQVTDVDVYIVHTKPNDTTRRHYEAHGARIVTLDPGIDVVLERVKTERSPHTAYAVRSWYGKPTGRPKTTKTARHDKDRGLGHHHRRTRAHLMAQHVDGTLCWWCGRPMYKDPGANYDHRKLEADHSTSRAQGGTVADRLLHGRCNGQRGDGSRDTTRPALRKPTGTRTRTTRAWT